MTAVAAEIASRKRIALVAHDNKKQDLLEWANFNRELLARHDLLATGTTGKLLEDSLKTPVTKLQSGPLGGDLQIGAKIAVVWNIPVACNRATADFVISSPLMTSSYERALPDYESYRQRLQNAKR